MLSNTVTRTGNQDHLVFLKVLRTQAGSQEGALGFALIPRLLWPPNIGMLLFLWEGPWFFCSPDDFQLKLLDTNSESPQTEFSDPSVKYSQLLCCDEPALPPASPLGWKHPQSRLGWAPVLWDPPPTPSLGLLLCTIFGGSCHFRPTLEGPAYMPAFAPL